MSLRSPLIFGLLAASLMSALPARAAYELPPGAFVIARQGADDARRSERSEDRRRDGRRAGSRQNDDERGYGYGYERRQRNPEAEEAASEWRRRDREHRNERSERGEDRANRGGRR